MNLLRPLAPPSAPEPRWTSRPLPPYRHVPGLTPHPTNHPDGHSFGVDEPPLSPGCLELPRGWHDCSAYLYGVDLFNRAFHWEAHEAWEAVWHLAGHGSPAGRFLQGLIQVSAALLQHHCGRQSGAERLAARAFDRLAPHTGAVTMGLDVGAWQAAVRRRLDDPGAPFPALRLGVVRSG